MRLGLTVSGESLSALLEKLGAWNANVVSKDEAGSRKSVVSFTHSLVV